MNVRLKVAAVAVGGLLAISVLAPAGAGQEKVYICHHTGSETNPVVVIRVAQPAAKGHLEAPGNGPHNKNSPIDGQDQSSTDPIDVADCADDGGGSEG